MSGILLDILAGTAVAVLSGMGVGSGGLLVVYLTLAAGRSIFSFSSSPPEPRPP